MGAFSTFIQKIQVLAAQGPEQRKRIVSLGGVEVYPSCSLICSRPGLPQRLVFSDRLDDSPVTQVLVAGCSFIRDETLLEVFHSISPASRAIALDGCLDHGAGLHQHAHDTVAGRAGTKLHGTVRHPASFRRPCCVLVVASRSLTGYLHAGQCECIVSAG